MPAHRNASVPIPAAQECRERIDLLWQQVMTAKALRETAAELRQYNAELRELLLESRLTALSRVERWRDLKDV